MTASDLANNTYITKCLQVYESLYPGGFLPRRFFWILVEFLISLFPQLIYAEETGVFMLKHCLKTEYIVIWERLPFVFFCDCIVCVHDKIHFTKSCSTL